MLLEKLQRLWEFIVNSRHASRVCGHVKLWDLFAKQFAIS